MRQSLSIGRWRTLVRHSLRRQGTCRSGTDGQTAWRYPNEVRIAPEGEDGYRFGVYAWYADVQQEIGELIPSFQVCISAGEQGSEEERAAYAAAHVLTALDAQGAKVYLQSALIEMPVREHEDRASQTEYFGVRIEEESDPVVLYDSQMPLDHYRRWLLCAYWIGDAVYQIENLEAEQ